LAPRHEFVRASSKGQGLQVDIADPDSIRAMIAKVGTRVVAMMGVG
jgi:hypothetical protein